MMASMGTPSGASQAGSIMGHWRAGVQKRELGCAQGSLSPGRGKTNTIISKGTSTPNTHVHIFLHNFFLPHQLPATLCGREQGEGSWDISFKRSSYLSIMVLPDKLCEKSGRGVGVRQDTTVMSNCSHVALTSAQRHKVRC